jgi:hypothetical protein
VASDDAAAGDARPSSVATMRRISSGCATGTDTDTVTIFFRYSGPKRASERIQLAGHLTVVLR